MRRGHTTPRTQAPDPKFQSVLLQKFINMVMQSGKKSLAESIVYDALAIAADKTATPDGLTIFTKAVENVRPLVEVKSRRVGGATYQVPIEVRHDRGVSLAMRWIRDAARARRGAPMAQRLGIELADAFKSTGTAVKKKEDTHKMAEANRAFAHYRW